MVMHMDFEVTKIGERGQIVIPLSLREEMGVHKGDKFMALQRGDMIILKKLSAPSIEDFERMIKKAHEHAEKHKLQQKDMKEAIHKARAK